MIRQKTSPSRLRAACGSDGFDNKRWEHFTIKRRWAKHLLDEATKSVQVETDSSWHNESPCKEELELLQSWVNETTDHLSMRRISLKST